MTEHETAPVLEAGGGRPLRPRPAWASGTGLIDVQVDPALVDPVIREVLQDRAHRYCWGFDERRIDVLGDCFTDDAVWRGSVMGETQVGPFQGKPAVLGYLAEFWPHQRDQRRHILTNFIIDGCEETIATALCYLQLVGTRNATSQPETTGLYRFDYRRQGDGWRISALTAGFDAPFWKGAVDTMRSDVKGRFGLLGQ